MGFSSRLWRVLIYLWVAPNSLIGLVAYALGVLGGARSRVVQGVMEVEGRGIEWLLDALPVKFKVSAITLGHVVLGRDAAAVESTRVHERVHVEQYRRWGPAFLPAYFLASLWVWLRGGDIYRDNPFEKEAFAIERAVKELAEAAGTEATPDV